ncbi:protein translocase subunit SecF [Methanococcoides sp. AM1]|uniref:protein translocase subunit SecF n=1 Tax=Methanococcoides sp. AM1 TaxID=1201011 RepID=UPI001083CD42|nr:protein translocase subunit SecF [Methanococcoides sp. AM1]
MGSILTEYLDSFIRGRDDKQLITIPLVVLALSLLVSLIVFSSTGAPVKLGLEFEGGTMIAFETQESADVLEQAYSDYSLDDARKAGDRVILQFGPMDSEDQKELEKDITSKYSNVEIKQIGALYGKELQSQALKAIGLSFLGMAIVVFLIFRTAVPSIAVVLSAVSDIAIAVGFMNLIGIELSLGTVAALLMLIGYSVDSDILLTTRVLKRRGTVNENIGRAMHTGLTMTTTTLAALVVMYIVSTFSYLVTSSASQVNLLSDISIVLIFGLVADIMNTWLLNTGILRWHVNRSNPRRRRA